MVRVPPIKIHPSALIAGLCYVEAIAVARLVPDQSFSGRELSAWSGIAIAAALLSFFAVVVAAQAQLRVALTSLHYASPQALVTTGLFRVSRHPIYVAFVCPLASIACVSVHAATLSILSYLSAIHFVVIANEEDRLRSKFGSAYTDYAARTRIWFGAELLLDYVLSSAARIRGRATNARSTWTWSAVLCVLGFLCLTLADDIFAGSRLSSLFITDAASEGAPPPLGGR